MCNHFNRQAVAMAFDLRTGLGISVNSMALETESASAPVLFRTADTMIGIGDKNLF